MKGEIKSSNAIYNVAMECSLRRANKKCREHLHSAKCYSCHHYVGRYIDADPRHIDLYMYQADIEVSSMKSSLFHNTLRSLIVIAFAIGIIAGAFYILRLPPPAQRNAQRFNQPTSMQQHNTTAHQRIEATLHRVARDIRAGRDMTGNGKVNCEDAAILFYMYYPIREHVRIMSNDNPRTGMRHAFNAVLIDGRWRTIEPLAYTAGWQYHKGGTYFMRDIWGRRYNTRLSVCAWNDYGRFVR